VAENSSADFGREEEKHFGSGMCGGVCYIMFCGGYYHHS
jgi:glutamate synthase domain-containing protein 3